MAKLTPDHEPGFWTVYPTEPTSRMQAAIQYPMTDGGFAARVVDAYAVDTRLARSAGRTALTKKEGQ